MSVLRTKSISIEASTLLFKPNCSVVKAKLKTRLRRKGRTTTNGIVPLKYKYTTYPNEAAMIA
jgi:hypothetical protein